MAPYQEEHLLDGSIVISISKDRLQAYVVITKALGGKDITFEDAKEALREKGVLYGIDEKKINTILYNSIFDEEILIAEGKEPQHGENGRILYHVAIHKQSKPQVLEDGTVNFKQLDLITNVKKGQLLAEVIPPTDGICGMDVFGNEITPQKGKPTKTILGKNVVESEDGLKLYSKVEGQVLIKDGKLHVSEVYEVSGDVGHATGNIKFNGKVVVKGNVKSGFTVEADGDIQVNGVVEGATLIAKGDIILNRGIQGNNQSYLECEGSLVAKYIENTKIKSLENIESDCILHSDVIAKKSITVVGKRGLIVGGQVRAGEEIRAKVIGSHMGTNTKIEVGIDPEEKSNYEKMKLEVSEIEKNLSNLKKTIELLNKMGKNSSLEESKKELLVKSVKTYDYLKENYKELKDKLKRFELRAQDLSRGKVHASIKIYPGVKVSILNAARHIYDELSMCTLCVKEGEIIIGPYEK
ncbi:hypothetical protein BJL90_16420 [Clostridium formicaceticum]|uniref:Flagellar Assembly Protein A N-terminal region domain-containing protein n=1 Tax=Clostridium formicaceticum TaxID=1497 RepID=A0ABM6EZH3_9CLOT|nr:hypothetical protein BJL90_16420 [Clostridium formicaceticum]